MEHDPNEGVDSLLIKHLKLGILSTILCLQHLLSLRSSECLIEHLFVAILNFDGVSEYLLRVAVLLFFFPLACSHEVLFYHSLILQLCLYDSV